MRLGMTIEELYSLTQIDHWFLDQIHELIEFERRLIEASKTSKEKNEQELNLTFCARRSSWASDHRIAQLMGCDKEQVTRWRTELAGTDGRLQVTYKRVDTCAAEFGSEDALHVLHVRTNVRSAPNGSPQNHDPGGGPNRIGQGIEFDYCCVHAAFALREEGIETIMVNCNPETVSTDYDTSDRLYFEPLTEEDVLNIIACEKPMGVVVQFGGQTPLKLALPLERAGVKILGRVLTPSIGQKTERFCALLDRLGLRQAASGMARSVEEAIQVAASIHYPVMVRPSYVLGGRSMQIVYDETGLLGYMGSAESLAEPSRLDRQTFRRCD